MAIFPGTRIWLSRASVMAGMLSLSYAAEGQIQPVTWTHLSSATGELPVPPANTGQSGLRVLDLDKDGDADYVITLWSASAIVWYRHEGANFEKYVIEPDTVSLSHGERFKDIDGDGDLDLIFGEAFGGNYLYWWENPYPNYAPGTRWVRRIVRNTGGGFYHDNIWGDFDQDGADEFISWNQYGQQLLLFELPADPKTSGPWPVTPIFSWSGPPLKYRGTDAIDINLDGKIDLVAGGGWFEHTGGTSFTYHPIDPAMGYSQIKAAQLIPGGRPEVVCILELEAGPLNLYEWNGSAWQGRTVLTNVPSSHTLQIGDVNQDGYLDIVTGELGQLSSPPENPGARLSVLYGDGTGQFKQQLVFVGQGTLEAQLADIDNDGDLDIVGNTHIHNAPRTDIWLNEGLVPVILPKGGTHSGQVTVSLSCQAGNAIYYTTDGSAPGTNSIPYTGPFTVNTSATVKAVSTQNGTILDEASHADFIIEPDLIAPAVLSVEAVESATQVTILFSEPVDQARAAMPGNYGIDPGITVFSAAVDANLRTVILSTSPLAQGIAYLLTINNLKDRSSPGNTIAANTQVAFSFQGLPTTGLALWLQADKGTVPNGSWVSQWTDWSGNNRHATQQSNLFSQPLWVPAAVNGLPTLRFDGVNDFLSFELPVNGLTGMSIFLVAASTQEAGTHAAQRAALFWNETAGWGTVFLSPYQSRVNLRFGTTQAGNQISYVRPALVGSAFTLSTALKDGTTDSLYVDRSLAVSEAGKLSTIAGCRNTGNLGRGFKDDTYFAGDLAEVLVYSRALSGAERQIVEQYLDSKYRLTTPAPPQIVIQPANVTVEEPKAANFSVVSTGTAPLSYEWRRGGVMIGATTSSSYTLSPTEAGADNGAQFSVVVSNVAGAVTSVVATLTVNLPVPQPPRLQCHPANVTVFETHPASFSVAATGTAPLSYQWRRGGVTIGAATNSGYTLSPTSASADDGADFDVIVSNAYGAVTSLLATLTVNLPVPEPPSIQSHPANLNLFEPQSASFTVVATGTAPLSYEWRRGGAPIEGATGSSYTLSPTSATADNGAQFSVVVSNGSGSVTSLLATLLVNAPTSVTTNGLALWLRGDAETVLNGSAVAQWSDQSGNNRHAIQNSGGSQPLLIQTLINGLPAVRFDGLNDFLTFDLPVNGLSGMSLFLVAANTQNQTAGSTQAEQAALFWNEIASWGTVYLIPFQSSVRLRFGSTQAGNQMVLNRPSSVGTAFTLSTAIKNGTTDSLYVNGAQVLNQGGKLGTIAGCQSTGNLARGFNNNTYFAGEIAEVLVYTRALDDAERQAVEQYLNSKYALTAPPPPQAPQITSHPANLTVPEPNAAIFSVVANGTAPLGYQWRRSGVNIGGATSNSYTLTPTSVDSDNGAQFDVVVSNPAGSVTSVVATLTVNAAPSIQTQPANVVVTEPNPATFSVVANGTAPLTYQWRRAGVNLGGATSNSYTLTPTSAASDNGAQLDVVVSNVAGSVTSVVATLTVNGPLALSIQTQPTNMVVTEPNPATFSVVANGMAPLAYQWRRGGVNLGGATSNSYMLTSTSAASDNGAQLDVVVSNVAGSVTSVVATLTVNGPLALSIQTQPTNMVVTEPNPATFSVVANGMAPLAYQWRRGGVNLGGATSNSYMLTSTSAASDNGAQFDVVVSNVAGSVTSVVATLTVSAPSSVPADGLALWLRADAGIVLNESAVSQWSDQSGNDRHALQASASSQPLLNSSAVNGQPALRFDGVNDFLTFTLPVNGLTGMTLFVVAANTQNQNGGASQAERAALFWNETTAWGTVSLTPFQSVVSTRFGTTQSGNQITYDRPSSVGTNFTLSAALKDGTTDSLYVNGTLVVSQGGKLPAMAGCRDTGNLGRGYNDNTFFAGEIAEVLVYNRALTAAERMAVEQYVDLKFGVTTPASVAPQITSQPTNLTLVEPNAATFNVVANGTAPFAYQWRRAGVNIGGATSSSYTLTPTSVASDNGAQFSVVVTNVAGSVTSAVATLTVNAASAMPTNELAVWLRADAGTVTNGAAVSQWSDQSGNDRHAIQATANNRPLLMASAVNGQPALRFDGLNDFLTFTQSVNGLTGMTLFVVAANTQNQTGGGTQAERAVLFWNESGAWGTIYLSPFQSAVNMRFGTAQAGNQIFYTRPASVGTNFTLTVSLKDGTTDALFVNGTQVVSQGGKLTTIAGCQDTGNVGRGYNNNTYFAGDIAEVLVYTRALTTAERQLVESNLSSKYALTPPPPPPLPPQFASQPADVTQKLPVPPPLSIARVGALIRLSWPVQDSNCILEVKQDLDPGPWTTATETAVIQEGQNVVITDATGPGRFYRLRCP